MLRIDRSHLFVAARSHPGLAGKQNEDRFGISAYQLSPADKISSLFAVVADGIGGHRYGEVAAEMAVNTVSHVVALSDGMHPLETIQQAIQAASQEIALRARDDTHQLGMGTTCSCIWVIGEHLYTASVGDSRLYLLRGGVLSRLTTDHTWVQEAIDKGVLDAESARTHPNVHIIRRYLGSARPPQADTRLRLKGNESDTQARENQGMQLIPGDVLLACTDGLTDELSDAEIAQVLQGGTAVHSNQELTSVAQELVDQACQRGGHDNITVILLFVPGSSKPSSVDHRGLLGWLAGGLLAVLLLLGTVLTKASRTRKRPQPQG
jgi:PPM family protein phosphatase